MLIMLRSFLVNVKLELMRCSNINLKVDGISTNRFLFLLWRVLLLASFTSKQKLLSLSGIAVDKDAPSEARKGIPIKSTNSSLFPYWSSSLAQSPK